MIKKEVINKIYGGIIMKLYIIGCVGSGKTTLAKHLSKQLNIPYYELDNIAYKRDAGGRKRVSVEEQIIRIEEIDKHDSWICEGVYRKSYHCLFERCDKIIYLDTPLKRRRRNIVIRFIKQQLKLDQCNYKSDLKLLVLMLQWNKYFEKTRYIFEKRIETYKNKVIRVEKPQYLTHVYMR